MTIFYTEGEKEFTSRPLAAFPSVQFRFSVNNPFFKSPSGQAVNQMHLRHFLGFLRDNARNLPQESADFKYDGEILSFWLNAKDYVEGKLTERYRIYIDSRLWLPARFERFDMAGTPLEFTIFSNYRINPALDGRSSIPGTGIRPRNPSGLSGRQGKTVQIRTSKRWRVNSWQTR